MQWNNMQKLEITISGPGVVATKKTICVVAQTQDILQQFSERRIPSQDVHN
jgi:hypothetical protein